MNEMYLGQPPSSVVKWCKKKYPKPTPLTIQALKVFTDDDLVLSVKLEEETAQTSGASCEFTMTCYDTSGAKLGSYVFSQKFPGDGTSTYKMNLASKLKEAGIDVDSMKAAGAKVELSGFKQWAFYKSELNYAYYSFIGQTTGCFQVYGSIDESFKSCQSGWICMWMFSNNPTVKAVGITFDGTSKSSTKDVLGSMFFNCTSLASCIAVDEKDVEHKTTLSGAGTRWYQSMFENCTSLVNAPELPATTLADSCYYSMFNGCSSLTSAPELPATALATFCYGSMFSSCLAVKELHYASAVENDSAFTGMPGSPKFGAENATVYFDL